MVTMRSDQIAAFETAALERFEADMCQHARRYFPNHLAIQGEACTREVIRLGVRRAAAHGLTGRSDVCRYLNLMWMFGSYFDVDPLLPWAAASLAPGAGFDPTTRMQRTARTGLDVFETTAGPDHANLNRALVRLQRILREPLSSETGEDGSLASLLATLYPAKSALLTPLAIDTLFAAAVRKARRHALVSPGSSLLLALAMFFCGSACDTDPQHGWLTIALTMPASTDDAARTDCLRRAALGAVNQWLTRRG